VLPVLRDTLPPSNTRPTAWAFLSSRVPAQIAGSLGEGAQAVKNAIIVKVIVNRFIHPLQCITVVNFILQAVGSTEHPVKPHGDKGKKRKGRYGSRHVAQPLRTAKA
jgi:hypothetical protein